MEISLAKEKITQFNQFIVAQYLKYGSVDEVFRQNNYDLPISYPEVHRLVKRWGIVKSAGPNSILSEAITFLTLLSRDRIPLESLYKCLPPSFKTSMGTMHRLLHNIKEGVVRRVGTALVITPFDNPGMVLVGNDVSTPRLELGKPFGAVTLPMGYSKENEDSKDSILRVLQGEVFTKMAIERTLPSEIIPSALQPFFFIDLADIRIAVYHLVLPESLSKIENFASFKVQNHRYLPTVELATGQKEYNFRAGISEIGLGYQRYLEQAWVTPLATRCLLNQELALASAQQL